jgi:hypothetical protein
MNYFDFRSALKSLVCSLALSSLLLVPSAHAQKPNVISWGENMSSWTSALGVNEMRGGCDIAPADCEPYLENLGAEQSSTGYYYVSFTMNPSNGVSYAEDWSKLSLTYKHMLEVDYDDFIGNLEDLQAAGKLSSPNTFVADVIAATKTYNPNLAFGITLYEDSLTHAMTTTTLTASTRAKIQYVHFYLHYRENASKWSSYLPTVKSLFPNAKIIAGAYPYDRIDFLPCAQGSSTKCTAAQEQSYFKEALENQVASFKAGQVSSIEFYFGYFGMPQDWAGWSVSDKICSPSRLSTCYANTSALQSISKDVLDSSSSSSSSGSLSFDYQTLNFGSEAVGDTTRATFVTVTNTGSSTVTFHDLTLGGSHPSDFSRSNDCPSYLGSGSRCSLVLYFSPKATGTRIANFTLSTSAGAYTYALVGTGTD